MEFSREHANILAENGNSKRKAEVKFSAKNDSGEKSLKQGKRFSEVDGLYIQNLTTVFLNFKNNFLGRLLKTGITKTVNKQWTCYKHEQNLIAFPLWYSEDLQKEKRTVNLFIFFYQIIRLYLKHLGPFVILVYFSCLSFYHHLLSHKCICKIQLMYFNEILATGNLEVLVKQYEESKRSHQSYREVGKKMKE